MNDHTQRELSRIEKVYAERTRKYDPLDPAVYLARQERERALIRWARTCELEPLEQRRLIDLGCGTGSALAEFLRMGFRPENLHGNDLLEDRIAKARSLLPADVRLSASDAARVDVPDESFDVVFQSMMCTSILDEQLLQQVVGRMRRLVRPGGGVLWYDFIYDNPRNPDVRGIGIGQILKFFPSVNPRIWRVTLAPPISRVVTKIHPALYGWCNIVPMLRTHVLCWLPKDARWPE
jgi:SAM-dependent methyltransferase